MTQCDDLSDLTVRTTEHADSGLGAFPLPLYLASPSLQLGQEQATLRSLLLGAPSWSEELCTEPSWSGLIDEPGPMLLTATVIGED